MFGLRVKLSESRIHVWIESEIIRITVNQCDFDKSYNLKLQQNHGAIVILSNPPPIRKTSFSQTLHRIAIPEWIVLFTVQHNIALGI
jgi:hypothetical protein